MRRGERPVPKRLRKIFRAAEDQGWTIVTTSAHPRLQPPPGLRDAQGDLAAPVIFASTPSDHRADKNSLAQLRRAGVEI